MIKEWNHRHLLNAVLTSAALLTMASCSDDDMPGADGPVPRIDAQLAFSLPQRIVSSGTPTRMQPYVVQADESVAGFRGLADVNLLCFGAEPTSQSTSLGEVSLPASLGGRALNVATTTDYSMACQVSVPIGATHFAFYAHAVDGDDSHESLRRYGALTVSGLGSSYTGLQDISFAPVPICTNTGSQGGSAAGQALVSLLNSLMATTCTDAAPDDNWLTAPDERLREAYRGMTSLTTLSSQSVERVLGSVYRMVNTVPSDFPGYVLAQTIAAAIADACATAPDASAGTLTLKDEYQGFPADLHLPEGAARIRWNAATQQYETPETEVYGKGLNVAAMTDYAYPANLQYQVISPIVASDSLALPGDPLAGSGQSATVYDNWQDLIDKCYADGYADVREKTQSVAMTKQVQYAVGRLDCRAILESRTLYDASGNAIDCSTGFTLKGVLIAGQRTVGYDFQPIEGSHSYVLYDNDLSGAPQHVNHAVWTTYNHTLGLPTTADTGVLMALELQNDGPDFQGADGRIAHGATFYLVADLRPHLAQNYSAGNLDRIFISDHITRVNLQVLQGHRDVNGDGKPDTDSNHDGTPDVYVYGIDGSPIGVDTNGDGMPDDYDANGDGTPDRLVNEDTNGDGTPDPLGWDTDNDGHVDIPITPNSDGSWPDTPTEPEGLATATYGIPTLTDPEVHRWFGLSVDLSWNKGINFNDVPL